MNPYGRIVLILLFLAWGAVGCALGQDTDIYITKTGEKYHRGTCRYLKYSSYKITLKEVTERGYAPCSVCRPPIPRADNTTHQAADSLTVSPKRQTQAPPHQTTTTQQCSATTKAGTRCKRMTSYANGKCWQHQ